MTIGHGIGELTPRERQIVAACKYRRHVYAIGGKRSGKSTGGVFGAAKLAYRWAPGCNGLAIAPTFPQLKDLFLEKWQKIAPPGLYEINTYGTKEAGPHILCYHPQPKGPPKTSFIYLRTEKAYKRIEGLTVAWAYVEELQDCPQAWSLADDRISDVAAPLLVRIGVGIPEAGWLEDEFAAFPDGREDPVTNSMWIHCQSDDNAIYLPKNYSKERLDTLSDSEYKQRILGLFVPAPDAIYSTFARSLHIRPHTFVPGIKVWCGKDFNINPQTACFFQFINGVLYCFDESVLTGSTQDHGLALQKWCRDHDIDHENPDLFQIIPDATGKKRGSEDYELKSNHDILRKLNFSLSVPSQNPHRDKRDAAVNWALKSAAGIIRLFFDPRCKQTIKSMGSLKEAGRDYSPWSHLTDCVGYVVCRLMPLRGVEPSPEPVSVPRPTRRLRSSRSKGRLYPL